MVAISIRNDETRSNLHQNFIAPFTTDSSQKEISEAPESYNGAFQDDLSSSFGKFEKDVDSNIIRQKVQDDIKEKPNQPTRWKFENYKMENWDRWKEIPFHLKEGEDTSKYFR